MPTEPKNPQNPAEGEAPQFVTKEDFAKLQEQANQQSAILRKEREAASKMQKDLTDRLEALTARFEQPAAIPAEPPKGVVKTDAEKAWELAQAKSDARIKELEAKTAAAEAKTADTEAKQRASEERQALSASLTAMGIDGPKQRAAIALIYGEDKRVVRTDTGEIAFKVRRGSGASAFDDYVSLEDGLKEWAATEEGKSLLPPRGAAGGGTVPGRAPGGKPDGKMTKDEAARRLQWLISHD
jgi:hypothetical protein